MFEEKKQGWLTGERIPEGSNHLMVTMCQAHGFCHRLPKPVELEYALEWRDPPPR